MTASSVSVSPEPPPPDAYLAARADLSDHVVALADARARAQRATATLDFERQRHEHAFAAECATLLTETAEAVSALNSCEQSLRGLAIAFGAATGERHPVPGIELITQTKLVYRDEDALTWAQRTGIALALARKEFERVAKSTALPFVTRQESLAVRIASDLELVVREAR